MTYGSDPWFAAVVLVVAGSIAAYRRLQNWRTPEPGTVEHAEHLYATGEIDHAELERRLDVLADPSADRIRRTAERIPGIGEATSWQLAAEFDTVAEMRAADRERLESVPNIGAERARAIQERL